MKKRSNKKAIIRIIEAFLAVLIVMGGVLFIMSRQQTTPDIGDGVWEKQRQVLDIIVKDDVIRAKIVGIDLGTAGAGENILNINTAISQKIPPIWDFSTNICGLDKICPNPTDIYDREVYSTEVVVSSTLNDYAPKKLRFFVWMKD